MGADAFHVGHEFVWTTEDVMVDALEHEAAWSTRGLHVDLVRIIDMAAAVGGSRYDLADERKLMRDGKGVMSSGGSHRHAQREGG